MAIRFRRSPLSLPHWHAGRTTFRSTDPNYREYVYVTNGGSGTVSVYDVVNVRVDREIAVGQNPIAIAANPTRNEVYVVNSGTSAGQGSVSVINAENNSVVATIPVHKLPVAIDLDADGKLAYVVNSGSNSISVLDLKSRDAKWRKSASEKSPPRRASLPTATPWWSPIAAATPSALSIHDCAQGARGVRRLPRRQRRGHSARFFEGICGLLCRPPGDGDRSSRMRRGPMDAQPSPISLNRCSMLAAPLCSSRSSRMAARSLSQTRCRTQSLKSTPTPTTSRAPT